MTTKYRAMGDAGPHKKPRSGGADADKSTRRGDRCLRRIVVIGVESADPSKKLPAWRQMRIPDERTSGAWAGRCEVIPDGRHEKPALQAEGYTATPHNTQGA